MYRVFPCLAAPAKRPVRASSVSHRPTNRTRHGRTRRSPTVARRRWVFSVHLRLFGKLAAERQFGPWAPQPRCRTRHRRWLLDGDDPSVRYFTLTLFGEPADGVAAAKARRRIMTEGAVPSSWRHSARRVIGANVSASTRQAHRHGLAAHHPRRTQRVWRRRAPAPCPRGHPCSQPRRATQ